MKCGFFQAQEPPLAPQLLVNTGLFYTAQSGPAEACGMQMGKGHERGFLLFFPPFFKSVHHCVYTLSSVMQPDIRSYLHTPIAPFTFYPSTFASLVVFLFLVKL